MEVFTLFVFFASCSAYLIPDIKFVEPDGIVEAETFLDSDQLNSDPVRLRTFNQTFEIEDGRIVNGNRARQGQFPYQAGLSIRDNQNRNFKCGGSLISNLWILTAAHCTYRWVSIIFCIRAFSFLVGESKLQFT